MKKEIQKQIKGKGRFENAYASVFRSQADKRRLVVEWRSDKGDLCNCGPLSLKDAVEVLEAIMNGHGKGE